MPAGDWEHWGMRECKTSSEGKKGRAWRPLRTRRMLVPCARFCLLSVEACSQGPQFSARWRHVILLGSWGFAATCLAQASPAAFAFRLAPRPASWWIVFILFLQPQLLPDSFQSVTPQLSISEPHQPVLAPSLQPSFRNCSAWAVATCQAREPSCGLDAAPAPSVTWSLLLVAPFSPYLPAEPPLLEGRYWDSLSVTCPEHSGQTEEVSWSCKSSWPRGSELAPSHFCLFFKRLFLDIDHF